MKKCPYCGSQIADECKFCSECGREYPMGKTCRYCGASIYEGDVYCENCGKRIDEAVRVEDVEEVTFGSESESKSLKDYLPLIIGAIVVVCLLGAGWWYWDSSNKRATREKAIADSLEIVRQDSIKAVKLKEEKEREENERRSRLESCRNYVEKFYNEYERTENQDEYLRKHCTSNALNTLREEFDTECDNGDCLATWIFFYETLADAEFIRREFVAEDENTCIVKNIYDGYTYSVTIGLVEENGRFKVDKIITSDY